MYERQLEKLAALQPVLEAVGSDELWGLAKFLYERIKNPDSYVVFIGETSSGKSTIINGLLQRHILPVSSVPTTGAIAEIAFDANAAGDKRELICRNGSKTAIGSMEEFANIARKPGKDVARLRLTVPPTPRLAPGLRLFDTPGYNSIVEEHEEVLKDFLPNADAVVYTIGYKIGIQDEDFAFLRFLRELVRPEVPIILAVNRCPAGVDACNPRIREIARYASDILGDKVEISMIPQTAPRSEGEAALPAADGLWGLVNAQLGSEARLDQLGEAFDAYVDELFEKCDRELKTRLLAAKMSEEQYQAVVNIQKDTAERLRLAIPELIEPAFARITKRMPSLIGKVADRVGQTVKSRLENVSKFDKEEEVNFINNFFLPEELRVATNDDVQNYIQVELADLNKKVDDYINQEMIRFNNKIEIQISSAIDQVGTAIYKKYATHALTDALGRYFVQFGGNGGAGAGVANAASHLLKKAGEFIGKRFSRETHNALKHFLAKFGATSMKAVGAAAAGLLELAFMAYDLNTWKGKVRKKVDKALDDWREDTLKSVLDDLKKLEAENIALIERIADETLHTFDDDKPKDYEAAKRDSAIADNWKNKYQNQ